MPWAIIKAPSFISAHIPFCWITATEEKRKQNFQFPIKSTQILTAVLEMEAWGFNKYYTTALLNTFSYIT